MKRGLKATQLGPTKTEGSILQLSLILPSTHYLMNCFVF